MTRDEGLVSWSLATFHVVAFLLPLLLLIHLLGGLDDLLPNLDTIAGLGIFGVLWTTTVFTTRRALRSPRLLRAGLAWGGVNGLLFFAVLGTLVLVNATLTRAADVPLGPFLSGSLFLAVAGTVVSSVLGAAVGGLLALLDGLAFALTRRDAS